MTHKPTKLLTGSLCAATAIAFSPLVAQTGERDAERDYERDRETETTPAMDERAGNGLESVDALLEGVRAHGDLSEIAGVLEAADPGEFLQEGTQYTLLLPGNEALNDLSEENRAFLEQAGTEEMRTFVRAHIIEGDYSVEEIRENGAPTLAGYNVEGSRDIMLRAAVRPVNAEGDAVGDNARVVEEGVEIAGITVHVTDQAWFPEAEDMHRERIGSPIGDDTREENDTEGENENEEDSERDRDQNENDGDEDKDKDREKEKDEEEDRSRE